MKGACKGLNEEESEKVVWSQVEKQYRNFCIYRPQITHQMPDRNRVNFSKRQFNGFHFEVLGK